MASSIWRKRGSIASPSIKGFINRAHGPIIDGLVVLAIGLSVGLYFGFSTDARQWAIEALGYGWAPMGLLVSVAIAALRYNHRILFVHWRRWIIGIAVVAICIGILSTIFPSDGALEDVSLGGIWGGYLGGTPLILAATKMAGIALVVPLIVKPKGAGMRYYRYARAALLVAQAALMYSCIGVRESARFIDRRARLLKYGMQSKTSRKDLLKMLVMGLSLIHI